MKAVGIFLVVFGHVIRLGGDCGELHNIIVGIIYSFHMPLFFVINGMVMRLGAKEDTTAESTRRFIAKAAKAFAVPYLLWSGVYMCLSMLRYSYKAMDIFKNSISATFTCRGLAPLWFLIALFMAEAVFMLMYLLLSKAFGGRPVLCAAVTAVVSAAAGIVSGTLYNDTDLDTSLKGYLLIALFRLFPSVFFVAAGYIGGDILLRVREKLCSIMLICTCSVLKV